MHRSGVVTSRCSSIAFADIDCCGTDEQVTAEGGGEQHAFGPLAWKRQNDVPKRVLKAAAFEAEIARVMAELNAMMNEARLAELTLRRRRRDEEAMALLLLSDI
jgi:hypothetical protein